MQWWCQSPWSLEVKKSNMTIPEYGAFKVEPLHCLKFQTLSNRTGKSCLSILKRKVISGFVGSTRELAKKLQITAASIFKIIITRHGWRLCSFISGSANIQGLFQKMLMWKRNVDLIWTLKLCGYQPWTQKEINQLLIQVQVTTCVKKCYICFVVANDANAD